MIVSSIERAGTHNRTLFSENLKQGTIAQHGPSCKVWLRIAESIVYKKGPMTAYQKTPSKRPEIEKGKTNPDFPRWTRQRTAARSDLPKSCMRSLNSLQLYSEKRHLDPLTVIELPKMVNVSVKFLEKDAYITSERWGAKVCTIRGVSFLWNI